MLWVDLNKSELGSHFSEGTEELDYVVTSNHNDDGTKTQQTMPGC